MTDIFVKNKVHRKVCHVNTSLLGDTPDWLAVRKAAEEAHPGFTLSYAEPGEIIEGMNTPLAFKGLYCTEQYDQTNFEISPDANVDFTEKFIKENPLTGETTPARWEKRLNKARYAHFKGLAIAYSPEAVGTRIGLQYGYINTLKDKE